MKIFKSEHVPRLNFVAIASVSDDMCQEFSRVRVIVTSLNRNGVTKPLALRPLQSVYSEERPENASLTTFSCFFIISVDTFVGSVELVL